MRRRLPLARDGRDHAIRLLDDLNAPAVDVRAGGLTPKKARPPNWTTVGPEQAVIGSPLTDSNRRPPPYHGASEAVLERPS
jgi:hypothetical protein